MSPKVFSLVQLIELVRAIVMYFLVGFDIRLFQLLLPDNGRGAIGVLDILAEGNHWRI